MGNLSANAADLAMADVYVPTPVVDAATYEFCDAYLGVQAGNVWGDTQYSGAYAGIAPATYFDEGKNSGVLGGLYAGCNFYQDAFLWGVEGDVNLLGTGVGAHRDWYGTLRLRGGASFGDTLVYGTGGLAFGALDMLTNAAISAAGFTVETPTAFGWTIGGGIEQRITDKVSWKTEYLYLDLGGVTKMFDAMGTEQMSASFSAHTVRTGVAVHF